MSLFGGIDIDDIPDSIKRGTYKTELINWRYYDLNKKPEDEKYGKGMFVLTFKVADKTSEYSEETGEIFVNVFKSEKLNRNVQGQITYDGEPVSDSDQAMIIKAIKFYKQIVAALKVDTELAVPGEEFDTVKGHEYYLTMYPDNNKMTRISANDPIRAAEDVEEVEDLAGDLDI